MHVIVIGGGVVGVTTAWELRQDGHQVSLIEAGPDVAQATSFANGGQIAVTESAPWSKPGLVKDYLRHLFQEKPYLLRLRADPNQWRWLYQFWQNSRPQAHQQGTIRNWHLAQYSLKCLHQTRQKLGNEFHYDDRQNGILQLFGPDYPLAPLREHFETLRGQGADIHWLEGAALYQQEPALRHAVDVGLVRVALWGARDESGDAAQFTKKLAAAFQKAGGEIYLQHQAIGFEREAGQLTALKMTTPEQIQTSLKADAFVICAGTASQELVAPFGLRLPIMPVKGYSLTVDIDDEAAAPQASLTDLSHRLVISRLGQRLRIAGYAEIGVAHGINPHRIKAIAARMQTLFPDVAQFAQGSAWSGLRPMTPDGAPIIDCAPNDENLWLNTGHGSLGWTFSHGSARLLADKLAQKTTEIDTALLGLNRP